MNLHKINWQIYRNQRLASTLRKAKVPRKPAFLCFLFRLSHLRTSRKKATFGGGAINRSLLAGIVSSLVTSNLINRGTSPTRPSHTRQHAQHACMLSSREQPDPTTPHIHTTSHHPSPSQLRLVELELELATHKVKHPHSRARRRLQKRVQSSAKWPSAASGTPAVVAISVRRCLLCAPRVVSQPHEAQRPTRGCSNRRATRRHCPPRLKLCSPTCLS
jgi:hypothetical protein